MSHDICRLKLAVNVGCYEFSAVVVWFGVFHYLFVCKYCIELGYLNRFKLCVHVTLFWCKFLSLKSVLAYSALVRYLTIPLGVLVRIPVGAKARPNSVHRNTSSNIKNVSVVCGDILNHWMKTTTSAHKLLKKTW